MHAAYPNGGAYILSSQPSRRRLRSRWNMHGVPEDDEGIALELLRAALAENCQFDIPYFKIPSAGYEKIFKHVIYVVPTFSNPIGKTMSLRPRLNLFRLAIEYDALVISDDVYESLY
ncbi:putative Pyridoxal phosphate-dependent transferase [Seiridium unicorne]|uniref:Pyridoxal phosphate-dependent transferase n=1 Tax=Seiridium unicorne TaxID=138068 RepID=A0ABR2UUC2_9PEZI